MIQRREKTSFPLEAGQTRLGRPENQQLWLPDFVRMFLPRLRSR
jgi:hypothetical protein